MERAWGQSNTWLRTQSKKGKWENGEKEKEDHAFPFFSHFLFCSSSLEGME
jgi:hypothetical protein